MGVRERLEEMQPLNVSRPVAPSGWEARAEVDVGRGVGEITTGPLEAPPNEWGDILSERGLDPDLYEVDGDTIRFTSWDGWKRDNTGKTYSTILYSFRATLRRRRPGEREDVEALKRLFRSYKPKPQRPSGERAFVACLADIQMGKADGDGAEGTITRVFDGIENVRLRYRDLRKINRDLGTLVIAGMGDATEACDGHYPGQAFSVELNNRDQEAVVRRLQLRAAKTWAQDFERVVKIDLPSNHGENRQGGKKSTDDADDSGLRIAESVAEVLAENPAYAHIECVIPRDEMVVVLDLHGTKVAFTHAHKAERGGGLPQAKLKTWWANQAFGKQDAGAADVLVSAHFHHYSAIDHGPRMHLQCPSLDGGSKWWQDTTGARSRPGILTFTVGGGPLDSGGTVSDIEVV